MNTTERTLRMLETPEAEKRLETLYGKDPDITAYQKERYGNLVRRHGELFGERGEIALVSAPGRTEIGGNHTDIITGGCSRLR